MYVMVSLAVLPLSLEMHKTYMSQLKIIIFQKKRTKQLKQMQVAVAHCWNFINTCLDIHEYILLLFWRKETVMETQ